MKPLYTKKNGTVNKMAAVEVTMPASYPASNVTYDGGTVKDALDDMFRVTIMNPNITVPAGGYNFCNYTAPTGYRLVSVNLEQNSLAIFCQITRNGNVDRLSFFNAYTQPIAVEYNITLFFVKA